MPSSTATVTALSLSPTHTFSKSSPSLPSTSSIPIPAPSLTLLPKLGIKGDAHCGTTVQHRSRLHIKPPPPNLRQVHLIHEELFEEFRHAPSPAATAVSQRYLARLRWPEMTPTMNTQLKWALGIVTIVAGATCKFAPEVWKTVGKGLMTRLGFCAAVVGLVMFWSVMKLFEGEGRPGDAKGHEIESKAKVYEIKPGDLGENITTRGIDLLSLPTNTLLIFVNPGEEDAGVEDGMRPTVRVTGLRNPCPQIDNFATGLRERCLVRDVVSREIVGRKAGIMGVVHAGGEVRVGAEIRTVLPEGAHKALECV